jgi:hypothetical protein
MTIRCQNDAVRLSREYFTAATSRLPDVAAAGPSIQQARQNILAPPPANARPQDALRGWS